MPKKSVSTTSVKQTTNGKHLKHKKQYGIGGGGGDDDVDEREDCTSTLTTITTTILKKKSSSENLKREKHCASERKGREKRKNLLLSLADMVGLSSSRDSMVVSNDKNYAASSTKEKKSANCDTKPTAANILTKAIDVIAELKERNDILIQQLQQLQLEHQQVSDSNSTSITTATSTSTSNINIRASSSMVPNTSSKTISSASSTTTPPSSSTSTNTLPSLLWMLAEVGIYTRQHSAELEVHHCNNNDTISSASSLLSSFGSLPLSPFLQKDNDFHRHSDNNYQQFHFYNQNYLINPMDSEYRSNIFKKIINSKWLCSKIFQEIRDFHRFYWSGLRETLTCSWDELGMICDWQDLGCFPEELIRFNMNDRYKSIFNHLCLAIKNDQSNDHDDNDDSLTVLDHFKLQFIRSLKTASLYGNHDLIEYIYNRCDHKDRIAIDFRSIYRYAMKGGHLSIIKFLNDKSIIEFLKENKIEQVFSVTSITKAAKNGHLSIVQYLHENRNDGATSKAMDMASVNSHLDIVKYLHFNRTEGCTYLAKSKCKSMEIAEFLFTNRTEQSSSSYIGAIESGDLNLVKYIYQCYPSDFSGGGGSPIDLAMEKGFFDIAEYLVVNGIGQCRNSTITNAAFHGQFNLVKLIHKQLASSSATKSNEIHLFSFLHATKHRNNLELVEFLFTNRSGVITSAAVENAASVGDLPTLRFLLQHGGEGTSIALTKAVVNGHSEVVKFLIENQSVECPPKLLDTFNIEKHFELFRYLHYKRPDLPIRIAMDCLAASENQAAMEWFINNRTERFTSNAFEYAIKHNRLSNIQWLQRNCSYLQLDAKHFKSAANRGYFDIVQYLNSQNTPYSKKVIEKAINSASIDIVKFLHYNRSEPCYSKAFRNAIQNKDLPILKFLLMNRTEETYINPSSKFYHYLQRSEFIKKLNI
ncbi:hypothetical protein PPL_08788 [Heterostelium album PN500]|uniref:BHLH domain-containing protein n=1 Tax=Heterostelium pallidum (strain ATCC 26659 / Pp 5 / PN500) TaxID=670386 RepID=D3BJQ9_HETP5|nr:hypothetical protein PPL_08788 [Heterostelium album PN500]EFA78139.1 hypothetical protein PPL_08788 [Heterostelium album PN500]|eukprot:XP_020430265.1 hypothetical protein PPL_08788 [Heterostelium album PN500]